MDGHEVMRFGVADIEARKVREVGARCPAVSDRIRRQTAARMLRASEELDPEDAKHGEDEHEQCDHRDELGHGLEHGHNENLEPGQLVERFDFDHLWPKSHIG